MLNVKIPENCGNAPKKEVLVTFITALCSGDMPILHAQMSDSFCFHQVGAETCQGPAFEKWVSHFRQPAVQSLNIRAVLTHGRQGAIAGTFNRTDGNPYSFCALCDFTGSLRSVRIGAVNWYMLAVPEPEIS